MPLQRMVPATRARTRAPIEWRPRYEVGRHRRRFGRLIRKNSTARKAAEIVVETGGRRSTRDAEKLRATARPSTAATTPSRSLTPETPSCPQTSSSSVVVTCSCSSGPPLRRCRRAAVRVRRSAVPTVERARFLRRRTGPPEAAAAKAAALAAAAVEAPTAAARTEAVPTAAVPTAAARTAAAPTVEAPAAGRAAAAAPAAAAAAPGAAEAAAAADRAGVAAAPEAAGAAAAREAAEAAAVGSRRATRAATCSRYRSPSTPRS